jgi:crotonobetainyl-CoA:carnitine CoA-transferase CaiB-like acyl-CoA transferase
LGAEVIKIEPPSVGDYAQAGNVPQLKRMMGMFSPRMPTRSLTLNLKKKEAQEIFKQLARCRCGRGNFRLE